MSAGDVKEALDGLGFDSRQEEDPARRADQAARQLRRPGQDQHGRPGRGQDRRRPRGGRGGPPRKRDRRKVRPARSPERRRSGPGRSEVAMELDTMFLKRTPPHSLEAERTVLGGILVQNENLNVVLSTISPEDLYRDAHRKILERIIGLVDQGLPVDLLSLTEDAQRAGILEEIGGASYLASLLDGVPRNLNVEYYAQIIKEKALLRRLILSSSRIIQDSYDQKEDADELLNAAQTAIVEIAEQRIKPGFRPMNQLTGPTLETIRETAARKEAVTGVPSGFRYLDAMTAGFQPVGARHPGGPAVHGQDGPGPEHLPPRRPQDRQGRRLLLHGDVRVADRQPAPLRRGPDRHPEDPDRLPQRARLREAQAGRRGPVPGPHLHRRVGGPDDHGDEGQVPPPEDGAAPGHRLRRLHPAHAHRRAVREPQPGDVLHLPVAQGAGQGAAHAGRRHLPAQPGPGEGPARAQAHALGPARVGGHRAGRRRRHLHLPARVLPPGRRDRPGHRRGQRGQAEERPDRRPPAGLHPRVRPFRRHGTVRAGVLSGGR
ncbi:MAG: hypothetical protein MZU95_13150 [Desulfomicrobium escambiense]|nr:hypothetical protein [Desulfomicrobium escambiense]